MTEQEAFDKMKEGDRDAMAWVYRNYRDRIAHFLMSKHATCGEEEARDMALDTVIRLAPSHFRKVFFVYRNNLLLFFPHPVKAGRDSFPGGTRSQSAVSGVL